MTTFRKALSLLSAREKRRGALVVTMVFLMAGLETAGVASVMPFLAVLGNPAIIQTNPVLAWLHEALGLPSVNAFLIVLGSGAFLLILFSAAFRTATHYVMNRYIEVRRHSIGQRLLETYLRQPYAFFLERHSSDLAKGILSEADHAVLHVYAPGMQLIAYAAVALGLVVLLFAVDPVLAASVTLVLGGMYAAVFAAIQGHLGRLGRERSRANQQRFSAAGEALAGIKDIKLLGREQAYVSRFGGPSLHHARCRASSETLSLVPKFLIEAVGFGGVIALTVILLALQPEPGEGALGEVLPLLGLYAFAGYRLLPAAQHIYQGLARLRFGAAAIDGIHEDLRQRSALEEIRGPAPPALNPQHRIRLEGISYTYPGAGSRALEGIDVTIPVGSSVGVVGSTGAGKTTMVDVVLGLLRPTVGALTVDDEPITESNLRAWQRTLGYVPQHVFLADTSVAENIALGVAPEDIDQNAVVRCARMAQVHEFITSELPEQYDSLVGEDGVRLSGGQRQRIGIARALYHDPSVLVFDEATSALDSTTEYAVLQAINAIVGEKTIIMVTHRHHTVRGCDQVVLLDRGRVAADGTFDQVLGSLTPGSADAAWPPGRGDGG